MVLDSDDVDVLRGESGSVDVACTDLAQEGMFDGNGLWLTCVDATLGLVMPLDLFETLLLWTSSSSWNAFRYRRLSHFSFLTLNA